MSATREIPQPRLLPNAFGEGFVWPLLVIAAFTLMIARGIYLLPEGYNGSSGLTDTFLFLLFLWSLGMGVRALQPGSRLASCLVALSLFAVISMVGSLGAASNAIGGGDYVDPWLVEIDAFLFPFYDWKAVATQLPDYEWAYWTANKFYNSMTWQPFAFIVITAVVGKVRNLAKFVTAWGLGLLGCIAPFHWFPALSPMIYYGVAQGEMPGHQTDLPWRFLPVMEGMRDGSIRAIDLECLTGMVTIPSFHACAATILAWAFWEYRWLRWPFLVLNIGMALAAVPIGSHYIIDIIFGITVGVLAAYGATALSSRSWRLPFAAGRQPGTLQPA